MSKNQKTVSKAVIAIATNKLRLLVNITVKTISKTKQKKAKHNKKGSNQ